MTSPYYSVGLTAALRHRGNSASLIGAMPTFDTTVALRAGLQPPSLLCRIGARTKSNRLRLVLRALDAATGAATPLMIAWIRRETVHIQWMPGVHRAPLMWTLMLRLLRWRCFVAFTEHNEVPHDGVTAQRALEIRDLIYQNLDHVFYQGVSRDAGVQVGAHQPTSSHVDQPLISLGQLTSSCPPELDQYTNAIEERRTILVGHIGGARPNKGLIDIVNASAVLADTGLHVTMIVAGKGAGSLRFANGDETTHAIIIDRILSSEETQWLLRHLSIAVFPYRTITASGALTASVAMGHAIITSTIDEFDRLLADAPNIAIRVPVGDSVGLARAIEKLVESEASLETAQQRTRTYASSAFSFDQLAAESERWYPCGQ